MTSHFFEFILQDWQVNQSTSLKSRYVLVMFRAAQWFGQMPFPLNLWCYFYQLIVEGVLSVELPWNTKIGPSLQLQHGIALVVNKDTEIGSNCVLRHTTSIGNKLLPDGSVTDSPKIGDSVEIGSNVVILGPVTIGDHAVIGAGSVVVKDVPPRAVVAGNPAKIIRFLDGSQPPVNQFRSAGLESLRALNYFNFEGNVRVWTLFGS